MMLYDWIYMNINCKNDRNSFLSEYLIIIVIAKKNTTLIHVSVFIMKKYIRTIINTKQTIILTTKNRFKICTLLG